MGGGGVVLNLQEQTIEQGIVGRIIILQGGKIEGGGGILNPQRSEMKWATEGGTVNLQEGKIEGAFSICREGYCSYVGEGGIERGPEGAFPVYGGKIERGGDPGAR